MQSTKIEFETKAQAESTPSLVCLSVPSGRVQLVQ